MGNCSNPIMWIYQERSMGGCTKRLQSCKNMDPRSWLKRGKSKYTQGYKGGGLRCQHDTRKKFITTTISAFINILKVRRIKCLSACIPFVNILCIKIEHPLEWFKTVRKTKEYKLQFKVKYVLRFPSRWWYEILHRFARWHFYWNIKGPSDVWLFIRYEYHLFHFWHFSAVLQRGSCY